MYDLMKVWFLWYFIWIWRAAFSLAIGQVGCKRPLYHKKLTRAWNTAGALVKIWPKASENAMRQILINYYKNLTFMESHMQDSKLKLHFNFKKAFWRKQIMLLSEDSTIVNKAREAYFNPAGTTQNLEIKI